MLAKSEITTNNIDNDIINNNISLNNEVNSLSYTNNEDLCSINLSNINALIDINDAKLKIGSRILCPDEKCFLNSIVFINPNTFEVNSDCGKHKNQMDIINYIKNSGLLKEEKEKCNECKKKIKFFKENKIRIYKCLCGKNVCENCKKKHSENNSVIPHNM